MRDQGDGDVTAVIDMHLNGSDGVEDLARLLRLLQPGLTVLFTSGDGEHEQDRVPRDPLLPKPFPLAKVANAFATCWPPGVSVLERWRARAMRREIISPSRRTKGWRQSPRIAHVQLRWRISRCARPSSVSDHAGTDIKSSAAPAGATPAALLYRTPR